MLPSVIATIFVIAYAAIALEHPIKLSESATTPIVFMTANDLVERPATPLFRAGPRTQCHGAHGTGPKVLTVRSNVFAAL